MSIDVSGIYQELDEEGKPAIGYFRYYGQQGTIAEDNPKTPFIDSSNSVAASAEQELNIFGRTSVQLFLQGLYSIAVYDKQKDEIDAVLVYRADQVGISAGGEDGGFTRFAQNLTNTLIFDESSNRGLLLSATFQSSLNYLDQEVMRWDTVNREITGGLNGTGNIIFDANATELVLRSPANNGTALNDPIIKLSNPANINTIDLIANNANSALGGVIRLDEDATQVVETGTLLHIGQQVINLQAFQTRHIQLDTSGLEILVFDDDTDLSHIILTPTIFEVKAIRNVIRADSTDTIIYGPKSNIDPIITSNLTDTTIEDSAINITSSTGAITIDSSGLILLDSSDTAAITATNAITLLSAIGSGTAIDLAALFGNIKIDASNGTVDIDCSTFDLLATTAVNIVSSSAIFLTTGGGGTDNIVMNAGAAGSVNITASQSIDFNTDTSMTLDSGLSVNTDIPFTIDKNTPASQSTDTFIRCLRPSDGDDGFINMDGAGGLSFGGAASDYRLKSDYKELSGILDKINKVKVYHGTFSKPKNLAIKFQRDYWIAHEMKEEFPGLVTGVKDEKDLETGKPIYQSIEWSTDKEKILWAGLGEACELIKDLTQRVVELEKI